jgi:phage FluMu gp28-like protein
MMTRIASQIPLLRIKEGDKTIFGPSGGWTGIRSADDPNSLRGEGLDDLVMDEAAYIQEKAWTEVLRPALSDRKGRAMFLSTPNGINWFHRLFQAGQDPLNTEWQSYHFPSQSNPFLDPEEIEAARKLLPERVFLQEYLAQFLSDGGSVFRHIERCVSDDLILAPQSGHLYLMGVDWGRADDFTVITVIDASTDPKRVVFVDRFNQIDWSFQRQRLTSTANQWKVLSILAEENSIGGPNIEALQADGLNITGFTTTNQSKRQIIEGLSLSIEQNKILYPNDPVLIGELQAYTLDRTPSGNIVYSAPPGLHDDMVMSLALANHAVQNVQPVVAPPNLFYH